MDKEELKSVLEAILFAWSDPLSAKDLSKVLNVNEKEIVGALKEMMDEFNYKRRGIQILQMDDHYQMATRAEHHEYLQKIFQPRQNKGLTHAALETLAIIAYKQPVTKIEIEEIRGVKCDKVISTLLERELIEEQGRLDRLGRPIIFGTTINFLKTFNLRSLKELPDIKNFDLVKEDIAIDNNTEQKNIKKAT